MMQTPPLLLTTCSALAVGVTAGMYHVHLTRCPKPFYRSKALFAVVAGVETFVAVLILHQPQPLEALDALPTHPSFGGGFLAAIALSTFKTKLSLWHISLLALVVTGGMSIGLSLGY